MPLLLGANVLIAQKKAPPVRQGFFVNFDVEARLQ